MSLLPHSFRTRLALFFGGLTLLVGGSLYFYIEQVLTTQLVLERGKAMHAQASAVAAVIADNLRERQREIDLLAQTPLYRRSPLSSPDIARNLQSLQSSYPQYSWVGVADAEGKVLAATGGLLVGGNVKARPWFVAGLQGSFTGDLHEAVLLAKLLPRAEGLGPPRFIDFAAPIRDDAGGVRGVLGAHADWKWVADVIGVIVPENHRVAQTDIYILSADGRIIHPDLGDAQPKLPAQLSTQQGHALSHWEDGVRYLSAMVAVPGIGPAEVLGWRVVIRQPEAVALASLHALQQHLIIFGIAAALIFMALTFAIATLMSRNLEKVASYAREIEQGGDPAQITLYSTTSEVRHLFNALRSMAAKLLDSQHDLERKVDERTAELAEANEELRRIARRDGLTGLYNRFAANEALLSEFQRMQRTGVAYAILLMDIDYFKRVNDTYGHEVGDLALQGVAAILHGTVRVTDFVARYGGEEFLVILPATGLQDAIAVAEKVRAAVAAIPAPGSGSATISIGVAMADKQQASECEAVALADQNLYRAKEGGRNRVVG